MKRSTKNLVKGKLHVVRGQAKEVVGMVTQDRPLQVEGALEKAQGRVQQKIGQIEQVLGK